MHALDVVDYSFEDARLGHEADGRKAIPVHVASRRILRMGINAGDEDCH